METSSPVATFLLAKPDPVAEATVTVSPASTPDRV